MNIARPQLTSRSRKQLTLGGSFLAAVILSIMDIPDWAEPFRPDWAALVLLYWCLAIPDRIGVGVGWLLGFVLDILYGSLLGQHALAKAVLAFLAVKMHLQVRMFPRWQQAMTVFVLIGINHLIVLWVKGATGNAIESWEYWVPSITSALIWPWLFLVLRDFRRRANIR